MTRRQLENAEIPATTLERLTAPDSLLERVAFGVYRLMGSPTPDHMELRAAWLQLAPDVPAWERTPAEGVVSHRSGGGALWHRPPPRGPARVHAGPAQAEPTARCSSSPTPIADGEWIQLRGLPATRPARIVSDLLYDHEDPGAVAQIIVDAIRPVFDYPGAFAVSLAPHAGRFGLRRNDGLALLRWLLDLVGDKETEKWMQEARNSMTHSPSASDSRTFSVTTGDISVSERKRTYSSPMAFRRALTDKLKVVAETSRWNLPQLPRQRWRTIVELTGAIADWLENFYNTERRHSALNYLTPDEFEGLHSTQPTQVALS